MINRNIVRLKVLQLVYAEFKNQGKEQSAAMKELEFSLSKTYDLYHYLLLLITDVTDYAQKRYESLNNHLSKIGSADKSKERFIKNRFAAQLSVNNQLQQFVENNSKHSWTEAEAVVKKLYKDITTSELFEDYLCSEEDSYKVDRDFWCKVYKKFIFYNEDLDAVLEEWSLYWNDDKEIVDTFVVKTIKRFNEAKGKKQPLLPEYSEDEDGEFAQRLFKKVLENSDTYEQIIRKHLKNWDFDRIAVMDIVIMVCAIAELLEFPSIEVSVTLNEYINLAKLYSAPKSASFVNGILDKIVRDLRIEKKLHK